MDFLAVQNFAANLRVFENGGVISAWNDKMGFFFVPGFGNSDLTRHHHGRHLADDLFCHEICEQRRRRQRRQQ